VPRHPVLPIDARIGRTLRDLRKTRRLTQQDLEPVLGVSFQQIQKIEHGANRLSVLQLLAAARFFGVGLEYFLPEIYTDHSGASWPPSADLELAKFAASTRGTKLLRSFLSIRDRRLRTEIERLIRALGSGE